LIPAQPPKEALRARRQRANANFRGEYYHAVPNPSRRGYRPGRKTATRQSRRIQ
jgi:hypothetical protein